MVIGLDIFIDFNRGNLPDQEIFKAMGVGNISTKEITLQIIKSYKLDD